MRTSSRNLDRFETTFDHDGIVANAGLIVVATLMARLGLETLIDRWVKTGSANPGRKILTVVAAMLAGGTHIDHVNMLRAGATGRVLGFKVMAPSPRSERFCGPSRSVISANWMLWRPESWSGPGNSALGPGPTRW